MRLYSWTVLGVICVTVNDCNTTCNTGPKVSSNPHGGENVAQFSLLKPFSQ